MNVYDLFYGDSLFVNTSFPCLPFSIHYFLVIVKTVQVTLNSQRTNFPNTSSDFYTVLILKKEPSFERFSYVFRKWSMGNLPPTF